MVRLRAMSGPVLVIELAEAVPRAVIRRLRDFLVRSSARFEEKRVGEYDLNIHVEGLGISETGGVVNAELREDQVPRVVGLPGVIATTTGPWPAAYGSAEFLRAWAQQPGFRLLK
jgi:hypothetical protein